MEPIQKVCSECGADNSAHAARCWMCYSDLKGAPEVVLAEIAPELKMAKAAAPAWAPSDIAQLWLGGVTCVLVLIVAIGIAGEEPFLLIPFAMVVLPALAAATIRVTRRRLKGEPTSVLESVAIFLLTGLVSFAVTVALVIVLIVGLIIHAIAVCLDLLGGGT